MKTKSIASICKKTRQIVLYDRLSPDGEILAQYISDGVAAYPVSGLPYLDEEGILTIFDIPEKQREKWYFQSEQLPEGMNFTHTDHDERITEPCGISIVTGGRTLLPLETRRGMVFIESRYLAPLADVLDVLEFYERESAAGKTYIVAKAGFLLQAVILPCDIITDKFVHRMSELARLCAVALQGKE